MRRLAKEYGVRFVNLKIDKEEIECEETLASLKNVKCESNELKSLIQKGPKDYPFPKDKASLQGKRLFTNCLKTRMPGVPSYYETPTKEEGSQKEQQNKPNIKNEKEEEREKNKNPKESEYVTAQYAR